MSVGKRQRQHRCTPVRQLRRRRRDFWPVTEQFISEPITPVAGTAEAAQMAGGAPGLPRRFVWRGREYQVERVLETWKESGRERGGDEMYLRKHWFLVRTTDGTRMKIYFERQARSARQAKQRWWLYSIRPDGLAGDPGSADGTAGQ
jgi:hypothetical protein